MAIVQLTGANDKIEQRGFRTVPEGIFRLRVESTKEFPGKDNKAPATLVKLLVVNASEGLQEEIATTPSLFLQHDRPGEIRFILDALGVPWTPTQGPGGVQGMAFDTDNMIGKEAQATMKHSPKKKLADGSQPPPFENWVKWVSVAPAPAAGLPTGGAPAAGAAPVGTAPPVQAAAPAAQPFPPQA